MSLEVTAEEEEAWQELERQERKRMAKKLKVQPDEVVSYCSQPRTSKQISDHFAISLVYAQQVLKLLRSQNRIKAEDTRDQNGYKSHTLYVADVNKLPAHDPFNLTGIAHGSH